MSHPVSYPVRATIQADVFLAGVQACGRREVLEVLAQEAALRCPVSVHFILDRLLLGEQRDNSGVGGGVAIVHLRLRGLRGPLAMLARLQSQVDFRAVDGEPVDLVFFLLSPEEDGPLHLCRLSEVSRAMRDHALCEALRRARNVHEMRALAGAQTAGASLAA